MSQNYRGNGGGRGQNFRGRGYQGGVQQGGGYNESHRFPQNYQYGNVSGGGDGSHNRLQKPVHGGGGRGRGRGGREISRWHDRASTELMRAVEILNENDSEGVLDVKIWRYADSNGWILVESLSTGDPYFFNEKTRSTKRAKDIPNELRGKKAIQEDCQPQNAEFPKPPQKWPKMKLLNNIRTNSYSIKGKLLENEIHSYLVEFDPPIPTSNKILRSRILFGGGDKSSAGENREWLRSTFGAYVFNNHELYSMGRDHCYEKSLLSKINSNEKDKDENEKEEEEEEEENEEKVKSTSNQPKIIQQKKPQIEMKEEGYVMEVKQLNKEYKVRFIWQEKNYLDSEDLPIEQQEALLNIFNRKRLHICGLTRVGKGWFPKKKKNGVQDNKEEEDERKMGNIDINDKCTLMMGYDCSIHSKSNNKNERSAIFTADLISKSVTKQTVYEIIKEIYNCCETNEEFHTKVEERLLNRHFVMSYNTQSRFISNINWKEDENNTFELKATGGKISYKDYLLRNYDVKSPKKEICIIYDQDHCGFLTQHMKLTLRSDEMKDFYNRVLQETNQPINERLLRTDALVRRLNKAEDKSKQNQLKKCPDQTSSDESDIHEEKKKYINIPLNLKDDFTIAERGRLVSAAMLDYPDIIFKGKQGIIKNNICDFQWKETGGFLDDQITLKQWAIIYDKRDEYIADNVYNQWKIYCSVRRFDPQNGPICEPQFRTINFNDESKYATIIKPNDQIILVILPDSQGGLRSSEIKALFTKYVQTKHYDYEIKKPKCLIQCIMSKNAVNKNPYDNNNKPNNALFGTFEDMMGKIGNILFKIDPKLPNQNKYIDINNTWCIGFDVSHVSHKPSVAMLCLNRKPLCGTCKYLTLMTHLNKERKEVISFEAMTSLMYNALEECWRQSDIQQNINNLPKAIICFRDGVPDNRLLELYSKEVVGIKRGIHIFKKKYNLNNWKYKLNYFVASKSILNKFGIEYPDPQNNKQFSLPQPLKAPAVVFDGVTSARLWDFIFYSYDKNKDVNKIKPLRYVCLKDELELSKNGGCIDLWQYIYALHYTFQFSIPFPLGGTAQVGPIVYAKHYAECFSQLITQRDVNIGDLQLDTVQLPMRPGLVQRLLDIQGKQDGTIQ